MARSNQKFENTLSILQERLTPMLAEGWRKIWVEGYHHPKATKLVFTIFDKNKYTMEFSTIKNFRCLNPDKDQEKEMELIDRMIEMFKNNELENYLK